MVGGQDANADRRGLHGLDAVFHAPSSAESTTYLRIFPLLSCDPEADWRGAAQNSTDDQGSLGLPWGSSGWAATKRNYDFAPELLFEEEPFETPDNSHVFGTLNRFHIFYLAGLGPIVANEITFSSVKAALAFTRANIELPTLISEMAERISDCGNTELADLVKKCDCGGGLQPILVFSGEEVSEAVLDECFTPEKCETISHKHRTDCPADCSRVVTASKKGATRLETIFFFSATQMDRYQEPVTLALQVAAISGHGPFNQRQAHEDLTRVEQSNLKSSDDMRRLDEVGRFVSGSASASLRLRYDWQRFQDTESEIKPWFDKHAAPFLKLVETDADRMQFAQRVATQYARLHARQSLTMSEELSKVAKEQLKTANEVGLLLKTTAAAKKASVAVVAVAAVLSAAGLFGALAGIPGTATLISPWPDVLAIALLCVYCGVFFAFWLYRKAVGHPKLKQDSDEDMQQGEDKEEYRIWMLLLGWGAVIFAGLPLAIKFFMTRGAPEFLNWVPHPAWVLISLVSAALYATQFATHHDFTQKE